MCPNTCERTLSNLDHALTHIFCSIRLFLPYRAHFMFHLDVPRFISHLQHPNNIHPALLNVLYMYSCSFSGGLLTSYEPHFLAQARLDLESSLAYADRIEHFMWASVLLGMYYLREGRVVEAYTTISALVRFAVCRFSMCTLAWAEYLCVSIGGMWPSHHCPYKL